MTNTGSQEIPKVYDPKACEERWYSFWEEQQLFHTDLDSTRPKYGIVIPPPNVTGRLHMGHALNNTLQDILCRYKRLQGHEVMWMPGTDHAGIATQSVVERQLLENEGKTRHDVGRGLRRSDRKAGDYQRQGRHSCLRSG